MRKTRCTSGEKSIGLLCYSEKCISLLSYSHKRYKLHKIILFLLLRILTYEKYVKSKTSLKVPPCFTLSFARMNAIRYAEINSQEMSTTNVSRKKGGRYADGIG